MLTSTAQCHTNIFRRSYENAEALNFSCDREVYLEHYLGKKISGTAKKIEMGGVLNLVLLVCFLCRSYETAKVLILGLWCCQVGTYRSMSYQRFPEGSHVDE